MKRERKAKLSIVVWCTIILFVENLAAVGISTAVVTILNSYLKESIIIQPELLVFIFSLALGIVIALLLNKFYIIPMYRINDSMNKVAKGDFSVRINNKARVTEIDTIYTNFNIMVEELGAMETIQSDFVSNVSHEIKTPINAIEGYSMLLQGSDCSDEQKHYIEKILFNTNRLSTIVGDILLVSKLDNQTINPKKARFSLDEQIRQAILMQEIKWTEKQIILDVEMDDVEFSGTEALLMHVWNNLISNAVKFSPIGGKISIRLIKQDEHVVFSITDAGTGIDQKDMKHIFDKFFQGGSERKAEGCGLGLALAQKIVNINGGEIKAENNVGEGCTFTVELEI